MTQGSEYQKTKQQGSSNYKPLKTDCIPGMQGKPPQDKGYITDSRGATRPRGFRIIVSIYKVEKYTQGHVPCANSVSRGLDGAWGRIDGKVRADCVYRFVGGS
jgi:hypothetical protein